MRKTVTIGIPAHNEEKNIMHLLQSLLAQKGDNFVIKHLFVACDGCTDNTAAIVRRLAKQYARVEVIDDGRRLGQAGRLNEFYKNLDTEIFITFDADVTITSDYVVANLVKKFDNKRVGLVGGRVYPLSKKTLIGKILEAQEFFWSTVVDSIDSGENLHSHTGPISAGHKDFLIKVKRPTSIVANDHFLYFSALKSGFLYKSTKDAFVYIKLPDSFKDYMSQSTRFIQSADQIKEYFGNWVDAYYAVAYKKKLQAYWRTFIKFPLYLPLALMLITIQKVFGFLYLEQTTDGLWTSIQSSK